MSAAFSIVRTAVITAPATGLFAQIEDLRSWRTWAPWEQLEPGMLREHSGADRGVGARYAWSAPGPAGAGSMEIVDASAGRQVVVDLHLVVPLRARWSMVLTLDPLGPDGAGSTESTGATQVTWTVAGSRGPLARLLARRVGMDQKIGEQLDRGLAGLARVTTSGRAPGRP